MRPAAKKPVTKEMILVKVYVLLFRTPMSPEEYAERARGVLGYARGATVVGTPPSDETFANNAIREACGDLSSMSSAPEVRTEKHDPEHFRAHYQQGIPGGGMNQYAIEFLKRKIAGREDSDYFNVAGYNVYVDTSMDRITGDGSIVIRICR